MPSRRIFSVLSLVVLGGLSGCLNNTSNDASTPVSGLSFLHSAPSTSNLNVVMDGSTLNTTAFAYNTYSGYVSVNPGSHSLRFVTIADQTPRLDTSVSITTNKSYTLFLYNQGSKLKSFVSLDESAAFATPTGMMVRVVHLSPDLPDVKVVLTGETKVLSNQIGYTDLTTFSEYTAKSSTVEVRSLVDDHVIATQTFDAQPKQFFTIAIMGFATPPAGNTNKLSIKVMLN